MPDITGMMTQMAAIIIGGTVLIFIGTFLIIFLANRSRRKKAEQLMASGKQGTAKILSLEDTGMRVNDNPRVRLVLEVTIPGYTPYQVQKTLTMPLVRLAQVQVGSVVNVVADPDQPDNADKLGLLLA